MDRLTPETDALAQTHDEAAEWAGCTSGYTELLDHARSLERERDALRGALREYIDHEDSRHDECPVCDRVQATIREIEL